MAETREQKKKRKKQQLFIVDQVQEETAVQNAKEVAEALEELDKHGMQLDIQGCPRCKSPKVKKSTKHRRRHVGAHRDADAEL